MVVLTAAAIGAGAYGVFKGGQAAAKQAKESMKEFGRQQKRSASLKDFNGKKQDRKERIANIEKMRSQFKSSRSVP